jgi:hypothetical protein
MLEHQCTVIIGALLFIAAGTNKSFLFLFLGSFCFLIAFIEKIVGI